MRAGRLICGLLALLGPGLGPAGLEAAPPSARTKTGPRRPRPAPPRPPAPPAWLAPPQDPVAAPVGGARPCRLEPLGWHHRIRTSTGPHAGDEAEAPRMPSPSPVRLGWRLEGLDPRAADVAHAAVTRAVVARAAEDWTRLAALPLVWVEAEPDAPAEAVLRLQPGCPKAPCPWALSTARRVVEDGRLVRVELGLAALDATGALAWTPERLETAARHAFGRALGLAAPEPDPEALAPNWSDLECLRHGTAERPGYGLRPRRLGVVLSRTAGLTWDPGPAAVTGLGPLIEAPALAADPELETPERASVLAVWSGPDLRLRTALGSGLRFDPDSLRLHGDAYSAASPAVVRAPDRWVLAWVGLDGRLLVRVSKDGLAHTTPAMIGESRAYAGAPALAWDPSSGRFLLTVAERHPSGRALAAFTSADGLGWTPAPPERWALNRAADHALACGLDGCLLAYLDGRADAELHWRRLRLGPKGLVWTPALGPIGHLELPVRSLGAPGLDLEPLSARPGPGVFAWLDADRRGLLATRRERDGRFRPSLVLPLPADVHPVGPVRSLAVERAGHHLVLYAH